MTLVPVDHPADPRVADYVGLTDAELRRRVEDAVFIVEGATAIERLLASPYEVRSLLVTARHAERFAALVDAAPDVPVFVASQDVMNAVVGFDIHRGALAAGARPPLPGLSGLVASATTVLVAEGLNDHENMGALFRNAAAFGVDAVVLSPDCCDPLYRRSVRVSMGHVLHMPFTRLSPWPDGLDLLRHESFSLAALTPDDAAVDVASVRWPERVALVVGAEGPGLSAAVLAAADLRVRIPMAEGVDSLNVATAAAVALHRLFAASP